MINKSSLFLRDERKQTNDSLNAERDKTNRSLANANGKTEKNTDEAVQKVRSDADQVTFNSRIEADQDRNSEREALGYVSNPAQLHSDAVLKEDRKRSDDLMTLERSKIDSAIDKERDSKNEIENQFLGQERLLTDQNLSLERSRTDKYVSDSGFRLSDEKLLHSKTKIALTSRDEFLAIVSHDLKNPIGAIRAGADILLEDLELDPEKKTWVHLIKRNAETSLRLIGDLLDMERLAKGKLELDIKKQNIESIFNETVGSFKSLAAEKNIAMTAVASVSLNASLDRDRILQVLSNLVGNALKFTPENGTITITAKEIPENIQIAVKDSGPGIPDDKKDFIFDRFAQMETKDRRGLGLGLYISKMLIEMHQGRLWVNSKVGEGSTFFIEIPLK